MSLLSQFSKLSLKTPHASFQRTFVAVKQLRPTKFTSILADVPVRPRSAWQLYLAENMSHFKNGSGKIEAQEATRQLGPKWKSLPDHEKKIYEEKYKKAVQDHEMALKKALDNATPQQFYDENLLRRKYKLPLLKDPKSPKRPKNGYLFYMEHLRQNGPEDFKQALPMEQSTSGSKMYRSLTTAEKKPFDDMAKKAWEEYAREAEKYHAQIQTRPLPKSSKNTTAKQATTKKSSVSQH
ncbi:uncharacterized protein BYT42DRAFT_583861 [Radiomyces spectabilis]|uniref:uncharacterized protein n=1 Tax=Radiomyces spectabilis TaxID=64574 RepID=UPI00221EA55E|nr:uncharacterized protein BYT42DRAFT_583861 [Radiomyces spectabilis]KAI8369308.1 hypothetical protein BYT42DRAFT_583861 [Radiomyces spectabilis]